MTGREPEIGDSVELLDDFIDDEGRPVKAGTVVRVRGRNTHGPSSAETITDYFASEGNFRLPAADLGLTWRFLGEDVSGNQNNTAAGSDANWQPSAILLEKMRDYTNSVEIPSSSIAYVWGRFRVNGEPQDWMAHVYVPGHDNPHSVTLKADEFEDKWDWDDNKTDTALVSIGVVERIHYLTNRAFASGNPNEFQSCLMQVEALTRMVLGPGHTYHGEPIYEKRKSLADKLFGVNS